MTEIKQDASFSLKSLCISHCVNNFFKEYWRVRTEKLHWMKFFFYIWIFNLNWNYHHKIFTTDHFFGYIWHRVVVCNFKKLKVNKCNFASFEYKYSKLMNKPKYCIVTKSRPWCCHFFWPFWRLLFKNRQAHVVVRFFLLRRAIVQDFKS